MIIQLSSGQGPVECELAASNRIAVMLWYINVLNRQFQKQAYRNVVVSDLTYVRVGMSWNYIYVLIDLFNRE